MALSAFGPVIAAMGGPERVDPAQMAEMTYFVYMRDQERTRAHQELVLARAASAL